MFGCNQIVTVYNRWRDPGDKQAPDVYIRHILPVLCKYKTKVARNADKDGAIVANTQMAIIPASDMYREPLEWQKLDAASRMRYFTLDGGDIVALGKTDIEITGTAPFRAADVREMLKPHVFVVKSVRDSTRDRRGRHFAVEGS